MSIINFSDYFKRGKDLKLLIKLLKNQTTYEEETQCNVVKHEKFTITELRYLQNENHFFFMFLLIMVRYSCNFNQELKV